MLEVKLVLVRGRATKREIKLHLPMMIGRRKDSDLAICHPLISRQHCELSDRDGFLVVSDSGSRNGTFVGNRQITEVVLRDGDEFTVGPLTFKAVYLVPDEDTADGPTPEAPTNAAPQNAAPTEAEAVSAPNSVDEAFLEAETGQEEDADLDLQLVSDETGAEDIEGLAPVADPSEIVDAAAAADALSTSSDDTELPAENASRASPVSDDVAEESDESVDLSDPIDVAPPLEDPESEAAQDPADVELDDLFLSTEDDLALPVDEESVDESEPMAEPEPRGRMSHGEATEDIFVASVQEDAQEKDTIDAASADMRDEDGPELAVEATFETEESDEIVFDELLLDEAAPPEADDQPVEEITHTQAKDTGPENIVPDAVDEEESDVVDDDLAFIDDDQQPGLMALGSDEGEPDFMALDDSSDELAVDDLEEHDSVDLKADTAEELGNSEDNTSTNGESGPVEKKKRSLWPFGKKRSSKKKGRSKKSDVDAPPATAPLEPVASNSQAAELDEIPLFESTDSPPTAGDETELVDEDAIAFLSLDEDDAPSAASSDVGEPVESTPPSGVSDEDLDDFLKGFD